MDAVFKGLLSGITISLLIGPIFVALVDITITKGWRSGLSYVLGIIFIDVLIIYFLNELLQHFTFSDYEVYIGIIGGIFLIIFGVLTFFFRSDLQHANIENIKTYLGAFVKGITINVLNPFVILWWIGIYTTIAAFNYSDFEKVAYYASLLSMVFLFDLLKIRFAYYIKNSLTARKLNVVKKIAGVSLFIFGIAMLVRVV